MVRENENEELKPLGSWVESDEIWRSFSMGEVFFFSLENFLAFKKDVSIQVDYGSCSLGDWQVGSSK